MRVIISNSSSNPIYEQIVQQIRAQILGGDLSEGEVLPSIRGLARDLQISVITTKRAYEELEREGFVNTVGGKGTFVAAQNQEFLREKKMKAVEEKLAEAVDEARTLGVDHDHLAEMLHLLYAEETDMEHALEIKSIGKAYKGFTLDEVSFELPRGYIMGLIGPNGAGKTTVIKLILNLVRRGAGSIRVLGLDNLEDEVAAKARIGYVPDEPHYPEDVRLRDLKAATAPFYAAWDEATFNKVAGEFELPLNKKFKTLSHGMKMKFALALALSHGAELIILDEPTSGLDPVFRRQFLDRLAGLLHDGQASVLFSTHITSDLERTADFVTFLRAGRVVFSSSKDEVVGRWAVVKGGRELLDAGAREFFEAVREREFGFEGLTSRMREARDRFGGRAAVDRASLDDIMVLMGRGGNHAA